MQKQHAMPPKRHGVVVCSDSPSVSAYGGDGGDDASAEVAAEVVEAAEAEVEVAEAVPQSMPDQSDCSATMQDQFEPPVVKPWQRS